MIDKLPEIKSEFWQKVLSEHQRLDNYLAETQLKIIEYLLWKIGKFFGSSVLDGKNESEIRSIREVWKSALCDRTPIGLLQGLYILVSCQTKYVDYPPPNPIAFHKVCLDARNIYIPSINQVKSLEDNSKEKLRTERERDIDYEIGRKNIEKIQAMLRKAMIKVK